MTPLHPLGAGFYGKVRTHGDFVRRGLSHEFVTPWDAWLQRGLLESRQRFGEDWLNHFLGMPLWCFALKPGVIDASAYAGVLMPGIDAVGRYFPFVIARALNGHELCASAAWYERAGNLALSTLKANFSLTVFEAALDALALERTLERTLGRIESPRRDRFGRLVDEGFSMWWRVAGEHGPRSLHRHEGALDTTLFLRLLDGS
jgi:type VI secretion system protein ImpM